MLRVRPCTGGWCHACMHGTMHVCSQLAPAHQSLCGHLHRGSRLPQPAAAHCQQNHLCFMTRWCATHHGRHEPDQHMRANNKASGPRTCATGKRGKAGYRLGLQTRTAAGLRRRRSAVEQKLVFGHRAVSGPWRCCGLRAAVKHLCCSAFTRRTACVNCGRICRWFSRQVHVDLNVVAQQTHTRSNEDDLQHQHTRCAPRVCCMSAHAWNAAGLQNSAAHGAASACGAMAMRPAGYKWGVRRAFRKACVCADLRGVTAGDRPAEPRLCPASITH